MAAGVGREPRSRAEDAEREHHLRSEEHADAGGLSLKLLVLSGGEFDERFYL